MLAGTCVLLRAASTQFGEGELVMAVAGGQAGRELGGRGSALRDLAATVTVPRVDGVGVGQGPGSSVTS